MIQPDTFQEIKEKYGHYASWALWAKEGLKPKDNIGDLSVIDPALNKSLFETLTVDFIFVGLNISRKIERSFGNFHDLQSKATDFKIRYAVENSVYWGAYMTDIIKDFEEKASGKMMAYLKFNKDFEEENIKLFKTELEDIGANSPTLIAFGKDAESILKRNLSNDFRIIGIPHYASYVSKENYRTKVSSVLNQDYPEVKGGR